MSSNSQSGETSALTVSQAMALAKGALENITVRIIGEVSEYSANARYKAVYFTIKDEGASLPCMMWKNRFEAAGAPIEIGSLVELTGRFTLYAAKGRMNFDVFSIELAGEGRLRMQVANLAKRLAAEGLMDLVHKKAIPEYPSTIGVVTSPRGAAVHDVLRTLRNRYPLARVLFAGVGVEGPHAPEDMSKALMLLQDSGCDVILLVRGGGSFEDLMPFNDEGLARTIFSMETPVVTGIGHEPDNSIADMVADLRASTPTQAADKVAPSSTELLISLSAKVDGINKIMGDRISKTSLILEGVGQRAVFSDPMRMFSSEMRFLDDSLQRLSAALPGYISSFKIRLDRDISSLKNGLKGYLFPYVNEERMRASRLAMTSKSILDPGKSLLAEKTASLEALSPLGVLCRGYSIARSTDGRVLSSIESVKIGDRVNLQMRDGKVDCTVDSIEATEYALEEMDVDD